MATIYPAKLDTSVNLPVAIDNVTAANANVINTLRGAILAIESALGVNPAGIYTTVKTRLDTLEALITNSSFVFEAGGDLSGTDINQKVISLTGDGINPIIINNSTLQFAPTLDIGNVYITQAQAVSGQGGIMRIQSQSAAVGSTLNGGALIIQSGFGDTPGFCGGIAIATADGSSNIIITHGGNISMTAELTLNNYISSPYLYTDEFGVVHAGEVLRANFVGGPSYTLNIDQITVLADVSGGPLSITLAPSAPDQFRCIIKNSNGNASINNITINAPGGETIEDVSTATYGASTTINVKSASITFLHDSTLNRWMII